MQNNLIKFVLCVVLSVSSNSFAQLNTPRGSQRATVTQRVGTTDISIDYSRPSVNGREIWGQLVPYGMNNLGFGTSTAAPWRAGADENTTITFTNDVKVEGKSIKAGTYGLHIEVKPDDKATLILSTDTKAWGSFFYDPSHDALRADITTKTVPHRELLTFEFNTVTPNSTVASLVWEKKEFPFTIEVDVPTIVLNDFRQQLIGQPGFQRQSWEQAATFALNNGANLDEALGWINNAIEGQFYSQKTFANLQVKSQILDKMGKATEAAALMDEALQLATVFEVHQYGRILIAQGKKDKALQVFKMNAEKHKNTWPVDVGLARGYSALGDYKKALKHLKIALTRVPDEANKRAIETNLAKLAKGEDIN